MSHVLLGMLVGSCLVVATGAGGLPAAAQRRHEEALAAMDRGELARADALLVEAYAEVDRGPDDALTFRAGRDSLLSSRRVVLRRLVAATDDPRPLCRLREFLDKHRSALVRALGERSTAEDTQGIDLRIREVDEALRQRAANGGAVDCATGPAPVEPSPRVQAIDTRASEAIVPREPTPRPAAIPAGDLERAERFRRAGAAVLASSVVPLGLMVFAIVRVERDARWIRELDAQVEALGRQATADEWARADGWYRNGVAFRATAIAAGLVGAVMTYSGIGLLVRARRLRQPPRMALAPSASGVTLSGSF